MLHGVSGKSGDKGGKYGLKIIYVKNSKHTWGPTGGTYHGDSEVTARPFVFPPSPSSAGLYHSGLQVEASFIHTQRHFASIFVSSVFSASFPRPGPPRPALHPPLGLFICIFFFCPVCRVVFVPWDSPEAFRC